MYPITKIGVIISISTIKMSVANIAREFNVTSEVRAFLPIDLPLVRRLTPYGVSLDTMADLTGSSRTLGSAVWGTLPLTDFGALTLILRDDHAEYVAQFHHRIGEPHARIAFIAPDIAHCATDSGWLALIDAMAAAAGRRGAYTLNADIAEDSPAFAVLRQCGFAIYARQEIWVRPPQSIPAGRATRSTWREESEADHIGLESLYASLVPRSVWQADSLPEAARGLIYERGGQLVAYSAVQEGRLGIYAQIVMRPEFADRADVILQSLLAQIPRAERLPLYVSVRRYQSWLTRPLAALNFTVRQSQALLVKHTTARIEHPLHKTVSALDGIVGIGATAPAGSGGSRYLPRRPWHVEPIDPISHPVMTDSAITDS